MRHLATRTVAAFDFDGTITDTHSLLAYLRAAGGRRRLARALVATSLRLAWGAVRRGKARDRAKEKLVGRVMKGQDLEDARRVGASFVERLLSRSMRPEIARRLEWHRSNGHDMVIVSASPQVYIEPAAVLLGMNAAICTVLEVGDDGRLTGRFASANCRGDQKASRLVEWIGDEQAKIWAYGNSAGDAEMLDAADVAVHVGRRPLADLP